MQQRNFSLHGAVDLGARQAAAQRQQASAAGGQDAPRGEYVFDVTEATFETDVRERSSTSVSKVASVTSNTYSPRGASWPAAVACWRCAAAWRAPRSTAP